MAAGARRRQLPAWMAAAGDERAAVAAPRRAGRRRGAGCATGAGERLGRRARALPAVNGPCALPRPAALYCMNEAELVEVALAVLAENLQCEEGEEKARSRSGEEQDLPPTANEASGSTTNTDGGSDHRLGLPSLADAERTGGEDSEDDVLKYVREIFFR